MNEWVNITLSWLPPLVPGDGTNAVSCRAGSTMHTVTVCIRHDWEIIYCRSRLNLGYSRITKDDLNPGGNLIPACRHGYWYRTVYIARVAVTWILCCHGYRVKTRTCCQGYLYKKSSKPLNKDWKKKYVTLLDDGRFSYFPSLHVGGASQSHSPATLRRIMFTRTLCYFFTVQYSYILSHV